VSYPNTAEHWKTDGTKTDVMPANGKTWTLAEIQALVGGLVQIVLIEGGQMLVNEEGHLKNLPFNDAATDYTDEMLVGDVVLSPEGMLT